jgi:phosphohistidine phosphatase
MKTLYLARHAKSSWDMPELKDTERPLNGRGKKDAPMMGKLLKEMDEYPDLIISSPAKRAFSTAKRIASEIGYPRKKIRVNDALYMADTNEFMFVISDTKKSVNRLMLVSHNYGVTHFANYISGSDIDNIPTAGIVRIDFNIASWKDIQEKKGKVMFFEYPKKHRNNS